MFQRIHFALRRGLQRTPCAVNHRLARGRRLAFLLDEFTKACCKHIGLRALFIAAFRNALIQLI